MRATHPISLAGGAFCLRDAAAISASRWCSPSERHSKLGTSSAAAAAAAAAAEASGRWRPSVSVTRTAMTSLKWVPSLAVTLRKRSLRPSSVRSQATLTAPDA